MKKSSIVAVLCVLGLASLYAFASRFWTAAPALTPPLRGAAIEDTAAPGVSAGVDHTIVPARQTQQSSQFHASINVQGLRLDDPTPVSVVLRRESNGAVWQRHLTQNKWSGILVDDVYTLIGMRSELRAYMVQGSAKPIMSAKLPDLVVNVVCASNWLLSAVDANSKAAVPGLYIEQLTGETPIKTGIEQSAGAVSMACEPPGKSFRYRVSALGYGNVEIVHHSTQGDVSLELYRACRLRILRTSQCAITVHKPDGSLTILREREPRAAGVVLTDVPAGPYWVDCQSRFGVRRLSVTLDPQKEVVTEIDELVTSALAIPVVLHFVSLLGDARSKTMTATLYGRLDSGLGKVERIDWHLMWREFAVLPLSKWESNGGGELSCNLSLLPGDYIAMVDGIGLQVPFTVSPVGETHVSIEAYDLVETNLRFSDWPDSSWPITVSWRYVGDRAALNDVIFESDTQAAVNFLRKPVLIHAISAQNRVSPEFRFTPGSQRVLDLCGTPTGFVLAVSVLRNGCSAYLPTGTRFLCEPVGHNGTMENMRLRSAKPSEVEFTLSEGGRYSVSVTIPGRPPLVRDVAVTDSWNDLVIELDR